jgi:hypothetical protein
LRGQPRRYPKGCSAHWRGSSTSATRCWIEHNLDVIETADYLIDLGPEGGERGGTIVGVGTPEKLAANAASLTGGYLKDVPLDERAHGHIAADAAHMEAIEAANLASLDDLVKGDASKSKPRAASDFPDARRGAACGIRRA